MAFEGALVSMVEPLLCIKSLSLLYHRPHSVTYARVLKMDILLHAVLFPVSVKHIQLKSAPFPILPGP